MFLELPTRPSPPAPSEPDPWNDVRFRCEHYARSSTRRQRWVLAGGTTDDAHTALVWLLDRALCLIEQLPAEAGRGVRHQLPDEEQQAAVLDALAEGRRYELAVTVVQPDPGQAPASATGGARYVEADTTHLLTIEPQPAEPAPDGTGRHRRTTDPTRPAQEPTPLHDDS
ncbi:hypothetical protein [Streptomyces sp. NPDC007083]|uniref:hypothetical protein n=1 Tax=Streptomyces sp. NPDC007083 TaxID=3156913 RepID=UPI0033EFBC7A